MLALQPEDELLLRCLGVSTNNGNAERVRALIRQGIDWGFVMQRVNRHRLAPLLYYKARSRFWEDLPVTVLDQFRNFYFANLARNVLMTRELIRILGLLNSGGIPVIALKGPVLAASVYGDIALRQFEDLDILVPKSDMIRAKCVLLNDDYQLLLPVPTRHEAFFLRSQIEHTFQSRNGRFLVDVHWALTPQYCSFSTDTDQLWQRSQDVTLEGTSVRTFCREDLLLILCQHGCKHKW